MNLTPFFESAYASAIGRRKLGFLLRKGIPFNGPHKFKVDDIKPGFVAYTAPFIRKNKNHLGGIHACCLATVSELSCGIALLSCLDAKKYRLIMQNMEVSYHYQAKTAVHTHFEIPLEKLEAEVIEPLKTQDAVLVSFEVKCTDDHGNHISTAWIKWQVKDWKKVRTKP